MDAALRFLYFKISGHNSKIEKCMTKALDYGDYSNKLLILG